MHDPEPVTYSGYLLDWACFNRTLDGLGAPDGSNVIAGPSAHYTGCLLLEGENAPAQCKAGGYYLGQQCGGSDNYHPKFDLSMDPVSHANAVAFLEGIHDPVARPTDIKVTVSGLNDHGKIINATFMSCTGDSCDGVCVGDEHACEGLNDDECTDNTVTFSGYIIDWNCWNLVGMGQPTPDGSDIVAAPWDHSSGCLTQPAACQTGYYLAMKDGDGNYHPYLSLNHSTSHNTVLTWLQDLHAANAQTDVAVTVSGVSHMGSLMHAKISACTSRDPAGTVTDGVFMGARGCDGTCTGNCACTLMDQSGCVTPTSATTTTTTTTMEESTTDNSTISFGSAAALPSVAALLLSSAVLAQ